MTPRISYTLLWASAAESLPNTAAVLASVFGGICELDKKYLSDISCSYMRDSRTAYVILGMLSIEPHRSGYDIRKAIENSVGHFWRESYGQIYPTLNRLTAEGLIRPDKPSRRERAARQRQEYSLTAAGHAALREWLALPFQNDPPRNEFLLKLFFSRKAAPGVAAAHVRELNDRNRRTLATMLELESFARKHHGQNLHYPYWMLTLSLGITLTQAALDWGESALATLAKMDSALTSRGARNHAPTNAV